MSQESAVSGEGAGFHPSRFTIRIKLLLVITTIVVLSLGGMLITATWLFRDHGEKLIQDYNLRLVRLNGHAIAQRLRDLDAQARLIEPLIARGAIDQSERLFFRSNSRLFYLGLNRSGGDRRGIYNEALLGEYEITREALDAARAKVAADLKATLAGATVFRNISPELGAPALAVSLPPEGRGGIGGDPVAGNASSTAILLILLAEDLLSVARAGGEDIFQLSLVDGRGALLAHSDEALALARPDWQSVPIVARMVGSAIDNGSLKYSFEGVDYLGSFQALDFGSLGVISTVEADRVFEALVRLQRRTAVIMLIVFVLAFLFVFFFSLTISVPIVKLVGATRMVEEGHYDIAIQPASGDEIGLLTNSFLHMAGGLKEKERIKDVFGKFVNPHVAEQALAGDLLLGGQKKKCAIFFSDLRNFTGMSEGMSPEQVVDMLNQYFTGMVACVHEQDGIVDKFIGDAIMAHWGAVVARDDDTARAIDAALGMRAALVRLNRHLVSQGLPALRFGCGINTGEVIAGQIGSEARLEYTVIGDPVNLASRIEYLNKHFGTDILISQASYNLVRGRYRVIPSPPISIKGKARPEVVYAILGRAGDSSAPQDLKSLRQLVHIEYDPDRARESIARSSDRVAGPSSELVEE